MKSARIIARIPADWLFRVFGWPRMLPFNLTCSLSFRCNSRCRTCNVYKKAGQEMTAAQWGVIFRNLGRVPFWVTISGGEPFLRCDLAEIVCVLYDHCRPSIINIPTNGLLVEHIPAVVAAIADHCRGAGIIVNVSIDDIGAHHDAIRGVQRSYEKAVATFRALKRLGRDNVTVGIHTVISRFNVDRIPAIYRCLRELHPDSYITEIAEERVELDTVGADITPDVDAYAAAVAYLSTQMRGEIFHGAGTITRAFRLEYYDRAVQVLRERRQVVPCYSGFASAQIAPDGDVWMCCTRADSIGNLADYDFDFKRVWFSKEAGQVRAAIRRGDCHCPLANAAYTNMLHSPRSLLRVARNFCHTG